MVGLSWSRVEVCRTGHSGRELIKKHAKETPPEISDIPLPMIDIDGVRMKDLSQTELILLNLLSTSYEPPSIVQPSEKRLRKAD